MRWRRPKDLVVGIGLIGFFVCTVSIIYSQSFVSSSNNAAKTRKAKLQETPSFKEVQTNNHDIDKDFVYEENPAHKLSEGISNIDNNIVEIECSINGRKRVPCLKKQLQSSPENEDDGKNVEVYVPFFSFLKVCLCLI